MRTIPSAGAEGLRPGPFLNPDRRIVCQLRENASASFAGCTQAAQNRYPTYQGQIKEFA
jgi:hypothetical protein